MQREEGREGQGKAQRRVIQAKGEIDEAERDQQEDQRARPRAAERSHNVVEAKAAERPMDHQRDLVGVFDRRGTNLIDGVRQEEQRRAVAELKIPVRSEALQHQIDPREKILDLAEVGIGQKPKPPGDAGQHAQREGERGESQRPRGWRVGKCQQFCERLRRVRRRGGGRLRQAPAGEQRENHGEGQPGGGVVESVGVRRRERWFPQRDPPGQHEDSDDRQRGERDRNQPCAEGLHGTLGGSRTRAGRPGHVPDSWAAVEDSGIEICDGLRAAAPGYCGFGRRLAGWREIAGMNHPT